MAERGLIEYITGLVSADRPEWLTLGVGDDCAVIAPPAGSAIVATTDMVIEGVHFEVGTAPELVGDRRREGVEDEARGYADGVQQSHLDFVQAQLLLV